MSKQIDDGGPAFSSAPVDGMKHGLIPASEWGADTGMSLRDWFAGMALSAVISPETHMSTITAAAQCCYDIADAMIEARKPKP